MFLLTQYNYHASTSCTIIAVSPFVSGSTLKVEAALTSFVHQQAVGSVSRRATSHVAEDQAGTLHMGLNRY